MAPPRPPPTEAQLKQSEEWKQKGNVAFRAKCVHPSSSRVDFQIALIVSFVRNFTEAFSSYTEAISLNPQSQTLYSNRSAALLSLGRLPLALNDAKRAVELDPKWAKGYRRKASVLDAMKRFREALVVYEEAIEITRADESLSEEQKKKEEAEVKKLMIGM
jgi:tetratricopeptide (TPR) repeat protein